MQLKEVSYSSLPNILQKTIFIVLLSFLHCNKHLLQASPSENILQDPLKLSRSFDKGKAIEFNNTSQVIFKTSGISIPSPVRGITILKNKYQDVKEENKQLKQAQNLNTTALNELQLSHIKLTCQLSQLEKTNAELLAQAFQLKEQTAKYQQTVTYWQSQALAYQKQLTQNQQLLLEVHSQKTKLTSEYDQKISKILVTNQDYQQNNSQLVDKLAVATAALLQKNQELILAQNTLQNLQAKQQSLEDLQQTVASDNYNLNAENQQLIIKIDDLQAEIKNHIENAAILNSHLVASQTLCENYQQELIQQSHEMIAFKQLYKNVMNDLQDIQLAANMEKAALLNEISTLKSSVDTKNQQYCTLIAQLSTLRDNERCQQQIIQNLSAQNNSQLDTIACQTNELKELGDQLLVVKAHEQQQHVETVAVPMPKSSPQQLQEENSLDDTAPAILGHCPEAPPAWLAEIIKYQQQLSEKDQQLLILQKISNDQAELNLQDKSVLQATITKLSAQLTTLEQQAMLNHAHTSAFQHKLTSLSVNNHMARLHYKKLDYKYHKLLQKNHHLRAQNKALTAIQVPVSLEPVLPNSTGFSIYTKYCSIL